MGAVEERVQRLDGWSPEDSSGAHEVGRRYGATAAVLDSLAVVECLYPLSEAGQVVLGDGLDPGAVDAVMTGSSRLAAIEHRYVELQARSFPLWSTDGDEAPSPERVAVESGRSWAGKPLGAMFTSAATETFPGAWEIVMAAGHGDGHAESQACWRLNPLPHRELVIDSALAWCDFAAGHLSEAGSIDWVSVAGDFDAIRITPRGVISIDCFEFRHRGRRIPPSYWGLESTAWLRWSFASAERLPGDATRAGSSAAS